MKYIRFTTVLSKARFAIFSLLILVFTAGIFQANAQQRHPFYANLKDWKYVSTDHFDVFFADAHERLAIKSARYAELAYHDLANLYDYKPTKRFTLYLLEDVPRLMLSHNGLKETIKQPGVFFLPKMQGNVVYPGSSEALNREVRKNVANLILREFFYGNRLGTAVQNDMLLNNSPWYSKGLVDYVGLGWSYEDEMWMSTIAPENLLDLALEGEGKLNKVVRKSIWHYISHEYGEQKLAEILYLVNISHSLESGIISVLGITLNTLTDRWREHISSRSSTNASGRTSLGQLPSLKEVKLKNGQELINFAYNPSKKVIALYLNQTGKHSLHLYNPETDEWKATGISSSFSNYVSEDMDISYPLAWSKDGNRIATTRHRGHHYELVFFDLENNSVEATEITQFDRILQIDWSHHGQLLALSALHKGKTDIFIGRPGEETFNAITNDPFDNLEPNWSFDDQFLFFASNRDTTALQVEGSKWQSYESNFDLYKYNRSDEVDTLVQLTHTPDVNERMPLALSSFEVAYRTDESGILNLNKINIFLKETEYITNLSQGLTQYFASESNLVFSTPIGGKTSLFLVNTADLPNQTIPELTLLRMEYLASFNEARKREERQLQKLADASGQEQADTQDNLQQEEETEAKPEVPTTVEEENEKEKPVRYYIFDEEEEPYEIKKEEESLFEKREKQLRLNSPALVKKVEKSRPDLGDFKVNRATTAQNKWSADYVELALGRRPDAGYYAGLGARFTDRLGNQQLQAKVIPYVDFGNFRGRSGTAFIRYDNLKNRVDWHGSLGVDIRNYRRENTLFPAIDSSIYRFSNININLGARYPLSHFTAIHLEGGFFAINRTDQKLLNQDRLDQSDQLLQAGVAFSLDKVQEREGYAFKGFGGFLSMKSYYSLAQGDFSFHTARLGLKGYTRIYKQIVLAAQLNSAFSVGNNQQRQYMGGIDDWIIPIFFEDNNSRTAKENAVSTDLYDYSFQQFVTPVRGFWFFSRAGTKFAALNTEIRIPISRMVKHALNSNPLYSIEIIPFLDLGSVWTSGVPFSQKNPTDTQVVTTGPVTVELQTLKSPFLVGFGSGFRTNFLGYSVRMDLAWGIDDNTLQRPVLSIAMGKNF